MSVLLLLLMVSSSALSFSQNSTFYNPILPGFHPDPSCIFVPELDNTFFCASSSFEAFPGIPIHASKDLVNWKLISNALNRAEQLPELALTNRSTSGIWGSALRYHEGTFWVVTTLVSDQLAQNDSSRWDNMFFSSKNPFDSASWSNPIHFDFVGYDTSPYWLDNGTVLITGSHPWEVQPGINQVAIDLSNGVVGSNVVNIWNGTGGEAPEGPHLFKREDGYWYLMIAEGGTGLNHMETIARSRNVDGPYEGNPANPIVTNANTSQYFQTVGHADMFQDPSGNWWGVALSTRSGPNYTTYPMGRETVLTPVTWNEGDFPFFSHVHGEESGWQLPPMNKSLGGEGDFVANGDNIDFAPGSKIPAHFAHWRIPRQGYYTISPPGHPYTLRLTPSNLNLTGYDGNYAGPAGQTFLGRRQVDTLFTYSVNMDFSPQKLNEEAGVSVFLTMNHHIDLGVVLLPYTNATGTTAVTPCFRFRTESYLAVPEPAIVPVPEAWQNQTLHLEIKAFNLTHYSFSAGPATAMSEMQTIGYGAGAWVSYGFTGTFAGVYATTNGEGEGGTEALISRWTYTGQGQYRN